MYYNEGGLRAHLPVFALAATSCSLKLRGAQQLVAQHRDLDLELLTAVTQQQGANKLPASYSHLARRLRMAPNDDTRSSLGHKVSPRLLQARKPLSRAYEKQQCYTLTKRCVGEGVLILSNWHGMSVTAYHTEIICTILADHKQVIGYLSIDISANQVEIAGNKVMRPLLLLMIRTLLGLGLNLHATLRCLSKACMQAFC